MNTDVETVSLIEKYSYFYAQNHGYPNISKHVGLFGYWDSGDR